MPHQLVIGLVVVLAVSFVVGSFVTVCIDHAGWKRALTSYAVAVGIYAAIFGGLVGIGLMIEAMTT